MMENVIVVKKNIKNINIRIRQSGEVYVSTPFHVSSVYVKQVLQKRAPWIKKKQESLKALEKNRPEENTIFYLGKKYEIEIVKSSKKSIFLKDNKAYIPIKKELDNVCKDRYVDEWHREEAQKLFSKLIKRYQPIVQKEINRVSIKKMRSRWGSCNHAKGYINLNLHLIKTPVECIEYVVFHELAHLIYPHHGKVFYGFIEKYMGDWKERKKLLEQFRFF